MADSFPFAAGGIRAQVAGEVATVTLERPDSLNSQTPQTWEALGAVASALPGTVRVVVLRGAGRAFSAGLDRSMFAPGSPVGDLAASAAEAATARIERWQRAFDWRDRPAVVSIAAVQGHAIGAGFQLALGADIRIVAEDVRFCMAEPTLGLVPDLGGTKRLVELVGYSRAAEICLTGRRVGAEEAVAIGLASRVVPTAGLDAAVAETVQLILAADRDAAAETKALLLAAGARSQSEQERAEREAQYRRLRAIAGLPEH
ncbi:MAG: enoyl-CoA hydratase/isomerase family protein [Jatrophihabitans sp.]|nr:MAG: enoyl-CoA hydratase/isomerase family protein [Jatrophihabitans sp.]